MLIQKFLNFWKNRGKKTLAIMSFDGIGDYLFIRLFFPYIQSCKKYKDYRFILIGRNNFAPFAQRYDNYFFEDIMWITDPQNPKELRRFLKKIHRYSIEELVCPTGGTDYLFAAPILKRVHADKKIIATAFDPAKSRAPYEQLADQMIKHADKVMFEFDRVKAFFEQLIEEPIPLDVPRMELPLNSSHAIQQSAPYAVLVPFTSTETRDWDLEKYAVLVSRLLEKYQLHKLIVLGSDNRKIKAFLKKINSSQVIAPPTPHLANALSWLTQAQFMITPDTSFLHFGAQLGVKTIYLAGSISYSIFHPYPKQFTHVCGIYPPQFLVDLQKGPIPFDIFFPQYGVKSLTPEYVFNAIDQFLCRENKL